MAHRSIGQERLARGGAALRAEAAVRCAGTRRARERNARLLGRCRLDARRARLSGADGLYRTAPAVAGDVREAETSPAAR